MWLSHHHNLCGAVLGVMAFANGALLVKSGAARHSPLPVWSLLCSCEHQCASKLSKHTLGVYVKWIQVLGSDNYKRTSLRTFVKAGWQVWGGQNSARGVLKSCSNFFLYESFYKVPNTVDPQPQPLCPQQLYAPNPCIPGTSGQRCNPWGKRYLEVNLQIKMGSCLHYFLYCYLFAYFPWAGARVLHTLNALLLIYNSSHCFAFSKHN